MQNKILQYILPTIILIILNLIFLFITIIEVFRWSVCGDRAGVSVNAQGQLFLLLLPVNSSFLSAAAASTAADFPSRPAFLPDTTALYRARQASRINRKSNVTYKTMATHAI